MAKPELSYEEAREQLVEIVRKLEAGSVPLSESMALWERGEELATICQKWLDGAKAKIDAARARGVGRQGLTCAMATFSGRYVIAPGYQDSDAGHWQTLWQAELGPAAVRVAVGSWDEPELEDWVAGLDAAMTPGAVIVAHSLGCLTALEWLARHPGVAAGAFLVAVPDPDGPDFPDTITGFARPRTRGRSAAADGRLHRRPVRRLGLHRRHGRRDRRDPSSSWTLRGTSARLPVAGPGRRAAPSSPGSCAGLPTAG